VKELRSLGLSPDFIVCRSEVEVPHELKQKIASFTNVKEDCVYSAHNVDDILFVPELLESQGIADALLRRIRLVSQTKRSDKWDQLITRIKTIKENSKDAVKIAMAGKYTGLQDSYLSVIKALEFGAINAGRQLEILWIDSSKLKNPEDPAWENLKEADGILVPGGFGGRGTEGKELAIKYARENNVPFLGICLGMQLAVLEFLRNV